MPNWSQPSRAIDAPEPGFFRMKLVRGGPWVPARIFTRLGHLAAEINGQPCDVDRVWNGGHFISEDDYRALVGIEKPPDPNVKVVMSGPPVF